MRVALPGRGKSGGFVAPMFIFAAIGLLGGAGDVRVLRSGPLKAGSRLRRHLWRMSTALLIASLSFSVRLPRILPAPLRNPVVYALPTLTVLVTMLYWLWRVRSKKPHSLKPQASGPHSLEPQASGPHSLEPRASSL